MGARCRGQAGGRSSEKQNHRRDGRGGLRALLLLSLALEAMVFFFGTGWHTAALRARPAALSTEAQPPDSIILGNPISGVIKLGETRSWRTGSLNANGLYSVEVSLDSPSKLTPPEELAPGKIASPITFNVVKEEIYPPPARVEMRFETPGSPEISKKLHAGDP